MYDNTDIKLKVENLINALSEKLKANTSIKSLVTDILENFKGSIEYSEDNSYLYLRKDDHPKAIIHLNINNILKKFSFKIEEKNERKILVSNLDNSILASVMVIAYLAFYSKESFDILITMNNIYDQNSDYSNLKDKLRTNNIINLNLKQSYCIAESFSSFTITNVSIPIKRLDFDKEGYSYFAIGINGLVGGHSAFDLDKVRSNAIKSLMSFVRMIKSKVDLEILSFDGGNRYDYIPTSAKFELAVKNDYVNDLLKTFEVSKNQFLEKNLKLEPNLDIYIDQLDFLNYLVMDLESYDHMSSFIELAINGAYSVDSSNGQLISSSIISSIKTYKDHINLIVIYRSLSNSVLDEMLEKTKLAAKVAEAEIENKLFIPYWKNSDSYLTEMFSKSYNNLFDKDLKIIKTQYSLDCNIIFSGFDVKMVSLGVKYKHIGNNNFYSCLDDISDIIILIEDVLSKIEVSKE